MKIGYFLSCEEWGPHDLVAQAVKAQAGRLRGPVDLRPLPPVERQAGPQPVRVVDDRRDRPGRRGDEAHHRRDLSRRSASIRRSSPRPRRPRRSCSTADFLLGVGSGEALNEHILGDRWPGADERLEMLEEAVEVIRTLWQGGVQSHRGRHYRVEHARIYDLPEQPAADHRLRASAPRRSSWRRGSATATAPSDRTPTRSSSSASSARRRQARAGRPEGVLGRGRGAGPQDRPRAVAQRGPARRAGPDPAHARALRAGRRAGHRGDGHREHPVRARRRRATSRRSRSTSRPASTSSTSTRSGPTRTRSSRPTATRCCRASAVMRRCANGRSARPVSPGASTCC